MYYLSYSIDPDDSIFPFLQKDGTIFVQASFKLSIISRTEMPAQRWHNPVNPGVCTVLGCVHKCLTQISSHYLLSLFYKCFAVWSLAEEILRKSLLLPAAEWCYVGLDTVSCLEFKDCYLMRNSSAFLKSYSTSVYCDISGMYFCDL